MVTTVYAVLKDSGVLRSVLLSPEIEALLDGLKIVKVAQGQAPQDGDADDLTAIDGTIRTGHVAIAGAIDNSPLPGLDLGLALPTNLVDPAPCKFRLTPQWPAAAGQVPTGFQFWLVLREQGQLRFIFEFLEGIPGLALSAAKSEGPAGAVELKPTGEPARVVAKAPANQAVVLGPALLVSAKPGELATLSLVPDTDANEGSMITLGFETDAVVFGDSGVGFVVPSLTFDDSSTAVPAVQGAQGLDPPKARIDADEPAWKGFVARQIDFYLPPSVPFFGGRPIRGYFEIAQGGGAQLIVENRIPADGDRPAFSARIECRDPTAKGLSGLLPTLISASMDYELDENDPPPAGSGVAFASGKPIRITATISRNPLETPQSFKLAIAASAQGGEGLIAVDGTRGDPSKYFNVAALMATSLFGDTAGATTLALIAGAGAALSSLFKKESKFVLHGAELVASGLPANPGPGFDLLLDYSVSAVVVALEIPGGEIGVHMVPENPLRIRTRDVRLTIDPGGAGWSIDFDHARTEVENPGAWDLTGLDKLFDVLGSRNGRGSIWFEVDLGFKIDLGPVKVSKATLRAALLDGGKLDVGISSLAASLNMPGALSGAGSLKIEKGGFGASLAAEVVPLNLAAAASLQYVAPGPGPGATSMTALSLAIDLPAPVPLANSGFGLMGIGGAFASGGEPNPQANFEGPPQFPLDPILRQLYWKPRDANSFTPVTGQTSLGFEVAIGTLPDLGFSFSAKAGLLVTFPDFSLRFGLNGKVMQPAVSMAEPSYPPGKGVSFIGALIVDPDAVDFAVIGSVDLEPLLKITVPLVGHFPLQAGETGNWYVHLGTDGRADAIGVSEGRSIGPITAEVLPDILGLSAEAYVMIRGGGITGWPARPGLPGTPTNVEGFVIAFGFGFKAAFGPKPVAWAELHASLDLLIGFDLPVISGYGTAGGSLHLGPFSLGVEAKLRFLWPGNANPYVFAQVTGRIELLFFDLEATVTVELGDKPDLDAVPKPDHGPIDRLGKNPDGSPLANAFSVALSDDSYRVVKRPVASATDPDLPTVWPDTLIVIDFSTPPAVDPALAGPFREKALPCPVEPAPIGTEVLKYDWRLMRIDLVDVTDAANPANGGTPFTADQLPCAWQMSRSIAGKTGDSGDLRELVLFSTDRSFWLNRLDRTAAGDRVSSSANACQLEARAEPGWAIGFLAGFDRDGCHLPPDLLSTDPCRSRVAAVLTHTAWHRAAPDKPTPLNGLVTLPSGYSIAPGMLVRWGEAKDIEGKSFEGHLFAPCLSWRELDRGVPDLFSQQRLILALEDAQTDGLLILVLSERDATFNNELTGLAVYSEDAGGPSWGPPIGSDAVPTGDTAFLFAQPAGDTTAQICIMAPLGATVGIVGLRGVTVTAAASAATLQASIDVAAAALADAAKNGPPVTLPQNPALSEADKKILAESRTILVPGRLYRLDIDMKYHTTLKWQDPDGKEVTRTDDGDWPYRLFFRTAAKAGTQPIDPGAKGHAAWLLEYQGSFEPVMIERFLAGYEPAEGTQFWFPDDTVRANFSQGYVPKLARAYGYDLELRAQRVDRPKPGNGDEEFWSMLWAHAGSPAFLSPVDQLRYEAISLSTCEQPLPGLTGSAAVALATEAWYRAEVVAVKAPPEGAPPPAPGTKEARVEGTLPGTTFRTSRWRNPDALLRGLGLATAGGDPDAGAVVGDLAIAQAVAPGASGSDQAFVTALSALGVEDWPPPLGPRLSRLWVEDATGAWLFAGLMIESPEPIPRAGRLELPERPLVLEMGLVGRGVLFDLVRDAGGFRLLFLTQAPVPVLEREPTGEQLHPALELVLASIAPPGAPAANVKGRLAVPVAPGFAGDP